MEKNNIKNYLNLFLKDYNTFFSESFSYLEVLQSKTINIKIIEYLKKMLLLLLKTILKCEAIPLYVGAKIMDTFILQKDYMPKNIKKISIPPSINDYYSIDENIKEKLHIRLLEFVDVLFENISPSSLKFFFRNINSLIISEENISQSCGINIEIVGAYNVLNNSIKLADIDDRNTLHHELFHLSSSYYDSKTLKYYSGFFQSKVGGVGINEGYTKLLTTRYFGTVDSDYIEEGIIAEIIEFIVGKDKMQELYFSASLYGLIEELAKFKDKREIMAFINAVDFCEKYNSDNRLLPTKEKKLENAKKFIACFLYDLCVQKVILDVRDLIENNRCLSYDDFMMNISAVFSKLSSYAPINDEIGISYVDFVQKKTGYYISKDEKGNMVFFTFQEEYFKKGLS